MICFTDDITERKYFVIFDKRRGAPRFWHMFTSRDFDHVWLLCQINGITVSIQPTSKECDINIWFYTLHEVLESLSKDVTAILEYDTSYKNLKGYIPRGIMSCVSLCKYLLGVGGFTFTPYRLYKQLKRLGAIEYGK